MYAIFSKDIIRIFLNPKKPGEALIKPIALKNDSRLTEVSIDGMVCNLLSLVVKRQQFHLTAGAKRREGFQSTYMSPDGEVCESHALGGREFELHGA
ncbi:MAG: hypothetical protein NT175_10805 [Bacteroidetes bacterium]|nr:hypothetical protein [Bacteroidota bacterium]